MTDHITLRGVVGTEPRQSGESSGTVIAKFRLVSNERRQDPDTGQWADVHSNWYTVSCFRAMATNLLASIHMGVRGVVYGKRQVRE
jgi:single-strand DNA-binding protein